MKVNIFSDEWCDLVFDEKNKEYGAYKLRKLENKRTVIAIFLASALFMGIFTIPLLLKALTPATKLKSAEINYLSILKTEELKKEENKIMKIYEPQRVQRRTFIFTPPVITNSNIDPINNIKTQNTMSKDPGAIGAVNNNGPLNSGLPPATSPSVNTPTKEEPPQIYLDVAEMPKFPGGDDELFKYLKQNIHYPPVAKSANIQGTVYLSFVIDISGKVINIKINRGLEGGCDDEAVRVMENMPLWTPGKQNGHPVYVQLSLPVKFTLR